MPSLQGFKTAVLPALYIATAAIMSSQPAIANEVTWYDGKKAPLPRGSLLTNNPAYWGQVTPTAVTYSYPEAPENPADTLPNVQDFGNRLLDGQRAGDWYSPVGVNGKPFVVEFDFKQVVKLTDVAVSEYQKRDLKLAKLEVRSSETEVWKTVYESVSSLGALHLLSLTEATPARYVRLTVQSVASITYISQVWMWGEAKAVSTSKNSNGFFPEISKYAATKKAAPGDGTILTTEALAAWRKKTGFNKQAVTWQVAPEWQTQKKNALNGDFLPEKSALRQTVKVIAANNETTSTPIFLINATDKLQQRTVSISPFKDSKGNVATGIESELFVAGSIWTRRWGQTFRPLFSEKNKLGGDLMEKYLTNGSVIKDFPSLHLPSGGTALLWVKTRVTGARAGNYSATISNGGETIPIKVQVQPVALPTPENWIRFWGNAPSASFNLWSEDGDIQKEMEYQWSLGATVWDDWPTKGSHMEIARSIGDKQKRRSNFIIPISSDIRDDGYSGRLTPDRFDDAFKKRVHDEVHQKVETAKQLGLSYDEWCIELWDEPTVGNMPSWIPLARLIKEADPKVQIFMNPLFWTKEGTNPEGFVNDKRQVDTLRGWYNELVDISAPIQGQVDATAYPEANREFYNHLPRKVRAFYLHPNPGRALAWDAFIRGYNGWGSYAYFAPRKDPWNDFDHPEIDYEIVYPGPNGLIPTIESESMRESWEDYRLLTLLKQQGKQDALDKILNIYKSSIIAIPGEETMEDRDRRSAKAEDNLPKLRDMALLAASR